MSGKIVNEGTPPPHECSQISAPGRPSETRLNIGAVWQCECGRFWQTYDQHVVDYEFEDAGYERRWREVKDAEGTQFVTVEIDPSEYLQKRFIGYRCTHKLCRRKLTSKDHRHYKRV